MLGPIMTYSLSTKAILRHSNGTEMVANIWLDNTSLTAGSDGRKWLYRGQLVTRKTTGGHFKIYASGASDGSEVLNTAAGAEWQCGILRDDVDLTDGPMMATIYVGDAQFETSNLTLSGATVGAVQTAMPHCKFL